MNMTHDVVTLMYDIDLDECAFMTDDTRSGAVKNSLYYELLYRKGNTEFDFKIMERGVSTGSIDLYLKNYYKKCLIVLNQL